MTDPTTPYVLTVAALKAAGACNDAMALVRAEFPDGVPLTEAVVDRMLAKYYGYAEWLVLDSGLCPAPALAEYRRVRAPAWAEYQRTVAPAWAEYQRVRAAALRVALLSFGGAR